MPNTLSIVQGPGNCGGGSNCSGSGSGTTITIPVGTAPAAGNLQVFACEGFNMSQEGVNFITGTNLGGTLLFPPAVFGYIASATAPGMAYILPSTSTGGTTSVTLTVTNPTGGSVQCAFFEVHPSANPTLVALDLDMALGYSNTNAPAGPSGTISGTSPFMVQMYQVTQTGFASPTAVSSPYNTLAYLGSSFGAAGALGTGTGATWTLSGTIGVNTFGAAWSFSPAPFVERGFFNASGGTNGANPTATDLGAGTFGGIQNGVWQVSITGASETTYSTAASLILPNPTGRLGNGANITDISPLGIQITGNGVAADKDEYYFRWSNAQPFVGSPMTLSFNFQDNFAQSDGSLLDCAALVSGNQTPATINCYGVGGHRTLGVETNSTCNPTIDTTPRINIATGTKYNVQLFMNPGNSIKLNVYNYPGPPTGTLVGSLSLPSATGNASGCGADFISGFTFGKTNPGATVTVGGTMYLDAFQWDATGTFPIPNAPSSPGCTGASPTWTANDTSAASVQACFNETLHCGDTILVPAGSSTWTTQVELVPPTGCAPNQGITVQGATTCVGAACLAGSGQAGNILNAANFGDTTTTCGPGSTCITLAFASSWTFKIAPCSNTAFCNITGFSFIIANSQDNGSIEFTGTTGQVSWRFHHNHLINPAGNGVPLYPSTGYGLVDHYLLDDTATTAGNGIAARGDSASAGYADWALPTQFGTIAAIYVEDSVLNFANPNGDGFFDTYSGASLVMRYNNIINTIGGGDHGTDSGFLRSALKKEIYNNNIQFGANELGNSRGGSTLWFNNHVTTTGGGALPNGYSLQYFRYEGQSHSASWGQTGEGLNWTPISTDTINSTLSKYVTLNAPDWQANHTYTCSAAAPCIIGPLTGNVGGGTSGAGGFNFYTATSCVSGSSQPAWNQTLNNSNPFSTTSDNTCVWKNVGGGAAASPAPGTAFGFCAANPDTICSTNATCAALSGGDTCTRYFDTNWVSGSGGYPYRDQPGTIHNQCVYGNYAWGNTGPGLPASILNPDAGSAAIIQPGRDYFNNTMPPAACGNPAYMPFTYPHPLQGAAPPPPVPSYGFSGSTSMVLGMNSNWRITRF